MNIEKSYCDGYAVALLIGVNITGEKSIWIFSIYDAIIAFFIPHEFNLVYSLSPHQVNLLPNVTLTSKK